MSREQIEAAIPHRPPMLLVDEIVSQSEREIVCRKTFRDDEFFVQGHYPGRPLVPGVILCESAMQAGAILLANLARGASGVPVVTRMNDVKFKSPVRPGDTIEIHVTLDEQVGSAYFLTARVSCRGRSAVRFQFACTMADLP